MMTYYNSATHLDQLGRPELLTVTQPRCAHPHVHPRPHDEELSISSAACAYRHARAQARARHNSYSSDACSSFSSYASGYPASSAESSPMHSYSYSSRDRSSSGDREDEGRGAGGSMIMTDNDKAIYNSLGTTSSSTGKPTCAQLGVHKGWQKSGIMWKTGPNPTWFTAWRRRVFILKGNFFFYVSPVHKLDDAHILGAVFLRNAVIEKISLHSCKYILKITPVVPRRKGWESDSDSSVFYIKFKSSKGRDEWYEELQQVAFEKHFPPPPTNKTPLITLFNSTEMVKRGL